MKKSISPSELILNDRGAIYHLDLKPDEIGDYIITVGDPQRVKKVSQYFDEVTIKRKKREFKTHTGLLNKKKISVISTGIGTDNIDIVLNEIDALVNVDFKTRKVKKKKKSLNFIRIGTSGTVQESIEVDSFVVNSSAIGIDGLGAFYGQHSKKLNKAIKSKLLPLYSADADKHLMKQIGNRMIKGVAITAGGFYAPQGRSIRYKVDHEAFLNELKAHKIDGMPVTNMEMETAGIYLLSNLLGHKALSCNAILANRKLGTFSKYPGETVDRLIRQVIQEIRYMES